ncbi:MAG: ubiquinol-cytochrome c reductase iron-sulfur subunit [Anaerolineae bacterium]
MSASNELTGGSQRRGISRRTFLTWALGLSFLGTLVGVLVPIIGYLWPPARGAGAGGGRVLVGTTKDLPVGQGKVVPVENKPVVVVNTAQGIRAFSAICTHLGCIVEWDQARQFILCPCHDGRFNPINGAVISGPPPAPLPPMEVFVEGENIYVGGA